MAFNLLGGYRGTLDMDILVAMTDSNLRKVVTILKNAGYRVKQPVDPIMIADKKTRTDWIQNKHMKAFNFYKGEISYEEVDIIIDSAVMYKEAAKSARTIEKGGLKLKVISPKNLIKMKKKAGRKQDLEDITVLRQLGR